MDTDQLIALMASILFAGDKSCPEGPYLEREGAVDLALELYRLSLMRSREVS